MHQFSFICQIAFYFIKCQTPPQCCNNKCNNFTLEEIFTTKKVSLFLVVALVLVGSFSQIALAETETLEGYADGFGGQMTVVVEKDGDTIVSVTVTDHSETAGVCDAAISDMPVAIVEANSTDVDTVSGATVSSTAIIAAVNNAIDPEAFPYAVEEEAEVVNTYSVSDNLWNRFTLHNSYDPDQTLTEDQINTLVASLFTAPTGGNQQSLEFFITSDRATMETIEAAHGYATSLLTAPFAVVISNNVEVSTQPQMADTDAGIAAMSLVAQAAELGMHSLMIGINSDDEKAACNEACGVSGDLYDPILVVAIGYPAVDATSSATAQMGVIDSRYHVVE